MKTIYLLFCLLCIHFIVSGQNVLNKIEILEPNRIIIPDRGASVDVEYYSNTRIDSYDIKIALLQKLRGTPFSSANVHVVEENTDWEYKGRITLTIRESTNDFFKECCLELGKTSLHIRQKGRYGNLKRFQLSGGGVVVGTTPVVIRLSGTEPGVKYNLLRDGRQVAYLYGPPNSDFNTLPEWPDDWNAERVEKEKWQCYLDCPIEFKVREVVI